MTYQGCSSEDESRMFSFQSLISYGKKVWVVEQEQDSLDNNKLLNSWTIHYMEAFFSYFSLIWKRFVIQTSLDNDFDTRI